MRFTAVERIKTLQETVDAEIARPGSTDLTDEDLDELTALQRAQLEADAMARIVNRKVAGACYRPLNIQHHAAGLAAYAVWLADLHGWNDPDWLHNG